MWCLRSSLGPTRLSPGRGSSTGNALEALDAIIDDETKKFSDICDSNLSRKLEARLEAAALAAGESGPPPEDRRVAFTRHLKSLPEFTNLRRMGITFGSRTPHKRVEVERFSEAFRMPELLNERPTALDVSLKYGTVRARIQARSLIGSDADLRLDVEPETDPDAKQLYMALGDWARTYGPKPYERVWLLLKPFAWMIGPVLLLCLFVWKVAVTPDLKKQEAYALLDKGLKADDEMKAIEILLALQSGYSAKDASVPVERADLFIVAYILLAWWVLAIAPTVVLGIGTGSRRIKIIRFIGNYFFISIPLCLFSILLKPYIENAIRAAFKDALPL
jgi:hypothetical protein